MQSEPKTGLARISEAMRPYRDVLTQLWEKEFPALVDYLTYETAP